MGATRPSGSVAVALSGGGKRASLFALGSLLALHESGLHVDAPLTMVTSVSGGSITNAAIAATCDMRETSVDDFRAIALGVENELSQHRHMYTIRQIVLFWLAVALLPLVIPSERLL